MRTIYNQSLAGGIHEKCLKYIFHADTYMNEEMVSHTFFFFWLGVLFYIYTPESDLCGFIQ